jgi:hypothetical protein
LLDEQPGNSAMKPRAAQSLVDRDIGDTSTIGVASRGLGSGGAPALHFGHCSIWPIIAARPRAKQPRGDGPMGIVPNVLIVTALELRYPVTGIVDMKAVNSTRDGHCIA